MSGSTAESPRTGSRLVPVPTVGRVFDGHRKVRLGDVDPSGRMRLDALTRYTQDVSNDDTSAAGLLDDLAWVVRRTTVEVHADALFGDDLRFQTFCSGLGKRWAERRLSVHGADGARYEVATLWVHIDEKSGRPKGLSDQFLEIYGAAASGRTVGARLGHPRPDVAGSGSIEQRWPLRAVDFDTLQHMNNAAYWAVVEESLAEQPLLPPFTATIEYGAGIAPAHEVNLTSAEVGSSRFIWLRVGDQVPASASLEILVVEADVGADPSPASPLPSTGTSA